jgi:hypothetical protein
MSPEINITQTLPPLPSPKPRPATKINHGNPPNHCASQPLAAPPQRGPQSLESDDQENSAATPENSFTSATLPFLITPHPASFKLNIHFLSTTANTLKQFP